MLQQYKWLLMFESRKHFRVCFKIMYFGSKGPALETGRWHNFRKVLFFFSPNQMSWVNSDDFHSKWNISICLTHMIIPLCMVVTAKTLFSVCLLPELKVGDWNMPPPCVRGAAAWNKSPSFKHLRLCLMVDALFFPWSENSLLMVSLRKLLIPKPQARNLATEQ